MIRLMLRKMPWSFGSTRDSRTTVRLQLIPCAAISCASLSSVSTMATGGLDEHCTQHMLQNLMTPILLCCFPASSSCLLNSSGAIMQPVISPTPRFSRQPNKGNAPKKVTTPKRSGRKNVVRKNERSKKAAAAPLSCRVPSPHPLRFRWGRRGRAYPMGCSLSSRTGCRIPNHPAVT